MNQRLSYRDAAPAVYKAMLALQNSVDKSGLEKTDGPCVPAHFTSQEVNAPTPTSIAASNRSINSKSRTSRAHSHLDEMAPTRDQQAQHLPYYSFKDGQSRRE